MSPAPRERLTAADGRFLAVCLLVAAGAVWFSARYFHRAFPEASIDFRVSRAEARALAERFLAARGLSTAGYREAARFSYDETAKTFLEREAGLERAGALLGSRVRLWRWSWRWYRPRQKEEFRVEITPAGEVAGFEHQMTEAAPLPRLGAAEARALAERFLRKTMGREPAALEFLEASAAARPARTDHRFTWKERDFDLRGASYRVEVAVLGSQVGGYREYLEVPEAWRRDYQRLRSRNMAAQSVDTALTALLGAGLLIVLVTRVRRGDVRWRRSSTIGLIGAGLSFLAAVNAHPLEEFGFPTTDSHGSFLAWHLVEYALAALAGGGLLFVLAAAAEPLYREHCRGQLSLGNLFRARGLRTRSFFLGTVLGLALAAIFVAYQTAFYLAASRLGAWSPADVPYSDMLNTRLPWLFVLLGGFLPAVSEEFLFRMFAIPFLGGFLRSRWAAVVLAGFLWGFGHAGYPQQPFWIRGVEVGIGGVALGLILPRWGILPLVVWHYSVDALYTALLLLRSPNPYFALSGAASAGIMALPALFAVAAYFRRGGFEPEAGLTNADEGSAPPAARPAAAPEAAPLVAYAPWTLRRRAAALALAASGLALLLVPVPKFGGEPRFALTAAQARRAADAFLRAQGMAPERFRTAVAAASRWDAEGSHAAEVARYFAERRPVEWVARAWRHVVPLRVWQVRYYRPLEKEEVRVAVHPSTGAIAEFAHDLPEERSGADAPPETARAVAARFLAARGFDPGTLELRESAGERRPARRDHTLTWEARPGDPRNLDEACFRVRVDVAGDRVTALAPSWKLPEAWLRARGERTPLRIALWFLRMGAAAAALVLGLVLLAEGTRRRSLRWRPAIRAAAVVAVLAGFGALAELPLAMQRYGTAVPLETYRATLVAGLLLQAVGLWLALACAAALAGTLLPAVPRGRAAVTDALCAAALAAGLAAAISQAGRMLQAWLHPVAIFSPEGVRALGAAVPALPVLAGAAERAVFTLAAAALAIFTARRLRTRPGVLAAAGLAVCAAAVPDGVHTAAEFALAYVLVLAGAAALGAFAWFARGNGLAWVLAAWTLAAGHGASALLAEPAFRLQGVLATAGWAAALAGAVAILRRPAGQVGKAVETA